MISVGICFCVFFENGHAKPYLVQSCTEQCHDGRNILHRNWKIRWNPVADLDKKQQLEGPTHVTHEGQDGVVHGWLPKMVSHGDLYGGT